MKSLKYIIIFIICGLLLIKPRANEVNKVEINLKKDEKSIVFILNNTVNALYIQDNTNSLIVLDYKNDEKNIEESLKENGIHSIDKLYTVTPVVINLLGVKSEYLKTDNNLIILEFYNNKFCIYREEYQNSPNLKMCKFVYTVKFKNSILKDLIGNPEVIFQNENNPLPIKIQETIYDNWTELYTINNSEYTILKINKDGFDTLVISK